MFGRVQIVWKSTLERIPSYRKNNITGSDDGKRTFSTITEKIQKSIYSAVYLSQHLLFSALTQPIKRTQKVNKDLTPSDSKIFLSRSDTTGKMPCLRPPKCWIHFVIGFNWLTQNYKNFSQSIFGKFKICNKNAI